MSANPGVRHFQATSQGYFNKLRVAVDPSHVDLTNWQIYKTSKKAGPFPKDSRAH